MYVCIYIYTYMYICRYIYIYVYMCLPAWALPVCRPWRASTKRRGGWWGFALLRASSANCAWTVAAKSSKVSFKMLFSNKLCSKHTFANLNLQQMRSVACHNFEWRRRTFRGRLAYLFVCVWVLYILCINYTFMRTYI